MVNKSWNNKFSFGVMHDEAKVSYHEAKKNNTDKNENETVQ